MPNFKEAFPDFSPEDIKYSDVDNEQLAVISYTSGTTGFSKGCDGTSQESRGQHSAMRSITCP
ncbi:MAG: hypothetical protein MZV63_37620 [Marinilabiliales bacterium]|nr:hypothetical protein [Marinilabiliales bacterium]